MVLIEKEEKRPDMWALKPRLARLGLKGHMTSLLPLFLFSKKKNRQMICYCLYSDSCHYYSDRKIGPTSFLSKKQVFQPILTTKKPYKHP